MILNLVPQCRRRLSNLRSGAGNLPGDVVRQGLDDDGHVFLHARIFVNVEFLVQIVGCGRARDFRQQLRRALQCHRVLRAADVGRSRALRVVLRPVDVRPRGGVEHETDVVRHRRRRLRHVPLRARERDNTVGGTTANDRNVISGNGQDGVSFAGVGAAHNTVASNFIGTNAAGTTAIANHGAGVYMQDAPFNTIEPMPGSDDHAYRIKTNGHDPQASSYDDLARFIKVINGFLLDPAHRGGSTRCDS
jgi:hypothetical protein